jgi:hypothetical protein
MGESWRCLRQLEARRNALRQLEARRNAQLVEGGLARAMLNTPAAPK